MVKVKDLEAIVGRKDYYLVDPKKVKVREDWNPRKSFESQEDEDLRDFIMQNGTMSLPPIFVKRDGDEIVLIDGERRLRATLYAIEKGQEIQGIPAILLDGKMNEIDQLAQAMSANQGKAFTPLEEAEAYKRFLGWGLTVSDIAKKVGKARSSVQARLDLSKATPEVKAALEAGKVGVQDVRSIVKEADGSIEKQKEKLTETQEQKAKGGGMRRPSVMSRKTIEKNIGRMMPEIQNSFGKNLDNDSMRVGILVGLNMTLHNEEVGDATARLVENITKMKQEQAAEAAEAAKVAENAKPASVGDTAGPSDTGSSEAANTGDTAGLVEAIKDNLSEPTGDEPWNKGAVA